MSHKSSTHHRAEIPSGIYGEGGVPNLWDSALARILGRLPGHRLNRILAIISKYAGPEDYLLALETIAGGVYESRTEARELRRLSKGRAASKGKPKK